MSEPAPSPTAPAPSRRHLTGLLLTGLALAACGGAEPPKNLLLITLDTTRADHLGCYGHPTPTPHLDALADEGFLVERALSVAPLTLPSHASIMTGLYPPQHGVRMNTDFRLPAGATTLAERLKQAGYATSAVVSAYVLSAGFGLDQGFDSYDEPAQAGFVPGVATFHHPSTLERTASETTDAALAALATHLAEPFFLWVHYFDPHAEYRPPEPLATRFADDPYTGEIANVDLHLGRLFDDLRERGLFDRTLIAVTADHGESLGQHGEATHGLFVYDAVLRVPLLLRLPGEIPPGVRSSRLVSGADLAPTLLELLELAPLPDVAGTSFAAAARGGTMPAREPVYAEAELPLRSYGWSPLYALDDGQWKFISAPQSELYELANDPGETRNLAAQRAAEVEAWSARLASLQAGWPATDPDARQLLDEESRAKLASLGYVSAAGGIAERSDRPDPKRGFLLHNALARAQLLAAEGDLAGAAELARRVVEQDPENPAALGLVGTLRCGEHDWAGGLELLQRAAERTPDVFRIQENLANALYVAGRLDDAAAAYRRALELQPFSGSTHYGLGNVLYASGDTEGAVAAYRAAIAAGVASPPVLTALGVALAASGDAAGAGEAFRSAVETDPTFVEGWIQAGILAEKSGDLERARGHYEKALELAPTEPAAMFNQAKVSLRLGRVEAAARGVAALLREHPEHPIARYLEAQVELARADEPAARRSLETFLAQPNADPRLIPRARQQLRELDG